jgi:Tol biopolymer transport system component
MRSLLLGGMRLFTVGATLACSEGGNGPDPRGPSVSITVPSTFRIEGAVTITATSASDEVAGVQFTIDGGQLGEEVTAPPYSIRWDTRTHANGTHVLSARARDLSGGTGDAEPLSVTVSNPLPLADRIVFMRDGASTADLFIMKGDGTVLTQLTATDLYEADPAVSPDGTKIAFTRRLADDNLELFLMNIDGSGQTNLTNHPALDFYPTWSPDGTRIAFTSERSGGRQIFVMRSDGSDPVQLTSSSDIAETPEWSPDGAQIAFTRRTEDGRMAVAVMAADGGLVTDLTALDQAERPAWSPDGKQIAFTGWSADGSHIFLMNADGASVRGISGSPFDSYPAWSRSGTQLIFERNADDGNDRDIWVMNLDGGGAVRLTRMPGSDISPAVALGG